MSWENSPTWSVSHGARRREYHRAKCLKCDTSIGTCRGYERLEEIKKQHEIECSYCCTFLDCFDCRNGPKAGVIVEAV